MNTMQLACFLAVAETLNFARAAEQLHVTQPAVTQQIHSLETELNTRLFRRTTRTVELTQEGLVFFGDAKTMMEIYGRAIKRSEFSAEDAREAFVIGCHSHNDVFSLAEILRRMKQRLPLLYPFFRVVPFQHLYQRLSEEAVDVVVAFWEGGLKKSIHYQQLQQIPVVGIAREGGALQQGQSLSLSDLKQEPLIVLNPQSAPEEYRKFLHPILENHAPMDLYFCDAIETALTLAQAGYGIALLPDFFQERNPMLTYAPIRDAAPISYGIYYKTLSDHPSRKAFVELAKACFLETGTGKANRGE